jgi:hypothetical protein
VCSFVGTCCGVISCRMVADEENLTSYNCYSVPKYARLGLGFKDLLILSENRHFVSSVRDG